MLGHIKDLFRQRKERQQKRFFSNHFKKPDPSPITSEMKARSITNKSATATITTTTTHPNNATLIKKKKKEVSTDNMTMVGKDDEEDTKSSSDELANILVEQNNKRRSQLPTYPGLERFVIIRKLGEYSIICFAFFGLYLTSSSSFFLHEKIVVLSQMFMKLVIQKLAKRSQLKSHKSQILTR